MPGQVFRFFSLTINVPFLHFQLLDHLCAGMEEILGHHGKSHYKVNARTLNDESEASNTLSAN